jgi:hypothetical protein
MENLEALKVPVDTISKSTKLALKKKQWKCYKRITFGAEKAISFQQGLHHYYLGLKPSTLTTWLSYNENVQKKV